MGKKIADFRLDLRKYLLEQPNLQKLMPEELMSFMDSWNQEGKSDVTPAALNQQIHRVISSYDADTDAADLVQGWKTLSDQAKFAVQQTEIGIYTAPVVRATNAVQMKLAPEILAYIAHVFPADPGMIDLLQNLSEKKDPRAAELMESLTEQVVQHAAANAGRHMTEICQAMESPAQMVQQWEMIRIKAAVYENMEEIMELTPNLPAEKRARLLQESYPALAACRQAEAKMGLLCSEAGANMDVTQLDGMNADELRQLSSVIPETKEIAEQQEADFHRQLCRHFKQPERAEFVFQDLDGNAIMPKDAYRMLFLNKNPLPLYVVPAENNGEKPELIQPLDHSGKIAFAGQLTSEKIQAIRPQPVKKPGFFAGLYDRFCKAVHREEWRTKACRTYEKEAAKAERSRSFYDSADRTRKNLSFYTDPERIRAVEQTMNVHRYASRRAELKETYTFLDQVRGAGLGGIEQDQLSGLRDSILAERKEAANLALVINDQEEQKRQAARLMVCFLSESRVNGELKRMHNAPSKRLSPALREVVDTFSSRENLDREVNRLAEDPAFSNAFFALTDKERLNLCAEKPKDLSFLKQFIRKISPAEQAEANIPGLPQEQRQLEHNPRQRNKSFGEI